VSFRILRHGVSPSIARLNFVSPQLLRRGLASGISCSALHAGNSTGRYREWGDFPNNALAELAHTRDHPQAFAIDPTSLQLMVDPAMQSIWTSLTNTPFDPVQHFASTTSRFTPDIDGFPSIEVREFEMYGLCHQHYSPTEKLFLQHGSPKTERDMRSKAFGR
jgi:hypothetical protein